eukprot:1195536-Prorocentrum_minimum.AAC.4
MTRSFASPLLGRRTRGQGALRQAYLPSPRPNFATIRDSGFPSSVPASPHLPGFLRGSRHSLWQPQFSSQTEAWFPPAYRARSEGIVSVLPCLQASRCNQVASSLVRAILTQGSERSSNKMCTGHPLGGHTPTSPDSSVLPVVGGRPSMAPLVLARGQCPWLDPLLDVGGAPLSSCPRWLIRYLVGAICPSRESTGICQGGIFFVAPVGVPWLVCVYVGLLL